MSRTAFIDGHTGGAPKAENNTARVRVRLRTVALPVEHGGWSLTLEPVALGLLVAPSPAGFLLAAAAAGAFLARHPFKIVAADRRRGRRFPRTAVAERFLLIYGGVALAAALAAAATADSYLFLLPLLAALPLASVQLAFDAAGRSRTLIPEMLGSVGLAAVAAGTALAGGRPLATSLGLWAVLAGRAAPSIMYVRARLGQLHGQSPSALPTVVAHVAALAFVARLAQAGVTTPIAAAALFLLLLRAVAGLYAARAGESAKRVGLSEIGYGAVTVVAVAAGYLL